MPLTSGAASGLQGMTLKAWAHVTKAGVLAKGLGFSGAALSGSYTAEIATALDLTGCVLRITCAPQVVCVPTAYFTAGKVVVNFLRISDGSIVVNADFHLEVWG